MLGSCTAVGSCREVLEAVRVTGGKLPLPGLGAEICEEGGVGPRKWVPLMPEWGRFTHGVLAGGVLTALCTGVGGLVTSALIFLVGGVSAHIPPTHTTHPHTPTHTYTHTHTHTHTHTRE